MSGMSPRWVSGQLDEGLPHLKLGARRIKFDLAEVAGSLRDHYGVQRIAGTLKGVAAGQPSILFTSSRFEPRMFRPRGEPMPNLTIRFPGHGL